MSKICSCFGKSKNINRVGLKESLFVFYEFLIKKEGFDVFCFGGVGEFDELCFDIVQNLKQEHKNLVTVLMCPKGIDKNAFKNSIKKKYDKYVEVENEFSKMPYLSRNLNMANASEFIVFFASEKGRGNETKVLNFAKDKNIKFVNFYK